MKASFPTSLVLLLFLLTGVAGCAGGGNTPAERGRTVRVAAAANLKFALNDLRTAFEEAHPDMTLAVTYGASGDFFAQLSHKAPFDLFLSADVRYPHKLVEQGLAEPDAEFRYAMGRLVAWVPARSALNLKRDGLRALLDPSVRKIALANPRHAPYGRAAEAALKKQGIYNDVKDRLVLGQDVEQAAQFLQTGAADVGLIPLSLAQAPALRDSGRSWRVPQEAHAPIEQNGVILSWAADPEAANSVRAFLTGPRGREILKRHGYDVPGE
jgi:molybdate transport system substrate-binding protein